jgi:hypothetical protein
LTRKRASQKTRLKLVLGPLVAALALSACGGKSARSHRASAMGAAGGEQLGSSADAGPTADDAAGAATDVAHGSAGGARSTASGGQATGARPSSAPGSGGHTGVTGTGGRAAAGGQSVTGGQPGNAGSAGAGEGGAAGAAGAAEVVRDAEVTALIESLQARAAAAGAPSEPWGELSLEDGPLVSGFGCPGMPLSETEQLTIGKLGFCGPMLGPPPYDSTAYLLVEASAAMLEPWGTSSRWQVILDALATFGEYYWAEVYELAVFPPSGTLSCSTGTGRTVLVGPYRDSDYRFFVQASSVLSEWSAHGDSPALLALSDALDDVVATVPNGGYATDLAVILGSNPNACTDPTQEDQLISAIEAAAPTELRSLAVIDMDSGYDVDPIAEAGRTYPFHISPDDSASVLAHAIISQKRASQDTLFPDGQSALPIRASSEPDPTALVIGFDQFVPRVPDADACRRSRYGGWYAALGLSGAQTIHLCPCTTQHAATIGPLAPCGFYGLERYALADSE